MGNYTTQDFIDTFGGLPERGDSNWAGPDPRELTDEDCTCGHAGPDADGNYDLIENPGCPLHGGVDDDFPS